MAAHSSNERLFSTTRRTGTLSTGTSSGNESASSSSHRKSGGVMTMSNETFLETVRQSTEACHKGDFMTAVQLYSEALAMDPRNHVLYSNRSAALVRLGKFQLALQDAVKARELCPEWPKSYYREGVALQCLSRYSEALAAFASGLAQDSKSQQLMDGLIDAALKSPLRSNFEPVYHQLQAMRLSESPFVLTSVIGQELLASFDYAAAIVVLEAALQIGTCSLKLRGSVFSALSSAYWAMNSLDKAISYMQEDLAAAKSLGDQIGECRAHGNLGSAYFSKGMYNEALSYHRLQLVLAMKCKDTSAAINALTSLGHVYAAIGDYPNALASHQQCVQLVRELGDRLQESREIGNVGAVYLAMGDFEHAVEYHEEHLRIAKELDNKVEEARAYSNLGSSFHFTRQYEKAIAYHEHVLAISQEVRDKGIEARAYAGLGHAARCMGDITQARKWHEKQLDMALSMKNKVAEARACCNLGIVCQMAGEYDAALKLHQAHLSIAKQLGDRAGMGRAFGNIGNAYSSMGCHEDAVQYHKQELTISKEVNDRAAEASTHGNLAVAYQALGMHEMALHHYHSHLTIARELKDTAAEACALCNLGSCYSSRGEFSQAVPYYENYLRLAEEMNDIEGQAKACHFLGYAFYCLGNYQEAIRHYEQDLSLAKNLQDKTTIGRAYCNLGLAHLALENYESALEAQKYFLAFCQVSKSTVGKFRALGNIGDVFVKMKNFQEAVKTYQKQLQLAKQVEDKALEASAYGSLGQCHQHMNCLDKALSFHTQELTLRQELNDAIGECRAHGSLGAAHLILGNHSHALRCYQEQLDKARELKKGDLQVKALRNLGAVCHVMGRFEEAMGYFDNQLTLMNQMDPSAKDADRGRVFGSIGECYFSLGDYVSAMASFQKYFSAATKAASVQDQVKAYRGLGCCSRKMGDLQQALMYFEKRLVLAHEIKDSACKAKAYADLADLHQQLENYEQALSCLDHQMKLAQQEDDRLGQANAASALGTVYCRLKNYERALSCHKLQLVIAEELRNYVLQSRALGSIGDTYEIMGRTKEAIEFQDQHLRLATEHSQTEEQAQAYMALGRIYHINGDLQKATACLLQGLDAVQHLEKKQEEAVTRRRLGMVLWIQGDFEGAREQFERTLEIIETTHLDANFKLSRDECVDTYVAMQRLLILLNRYEDALLIAERCRCICDSHHTVPTSIAQLMETVNRQRASILYHSIAGGFLCSWLIIPQKGVVKFSEANISGRNISCNPDMSGTLPDCAKVIEDHLENVREALGTNAELDDFNETNEADRRSGFTRNHLLNTSSYSLSSLFSVGSVSIASAPASRAGSLRAPRFQWSGPPSLHALYELLVAPFEDHLNSHELVIIADKQLLTVPFSLLRGDGLMEYLCERFSLTCSFSIASLKKPKIISRNASDEISSLIVGNVHLSAAIHEALDLEDMSHTDEEADLVAEVLNGKPLMGTSATKEAILSQICEAHCIHLAVNLNWKLKAFVLATGEEEDEDENAIVPPFSDFTLTAEEISRMRLVARLVVISSTQSTGPTNDSLRDICQAFLSAGAQCVMVCLWPIPSTATKLLFRTLYSSLLQGSRVGSALADAMCTIQATKHFAHPVNWAGFTAFGADVLVSSQVALMGQALADLLKTPQKCRDALRVCLHLVEKSIQRIQRGYKTAMYTAQKSIEAKVGQVQGWRELLISAGFRFEPAANGLPAAVFFPQSDPGERLLQCSVNLQAVLGLPVPSLCAMSKLLVGAEYADDIIQVLRQIISQLSKTDDGLMGNMDCPVDVKLWNVPGCHELFASLGFDLMEVGRDHVTLRMGKQATRRNIQFALQSLLAVFDTSEAANNMALDESDSSVNSLDADGSGDEEIPMAPMSFMNRQPIQLGGGAFMSYVRTRGEPDGLSASAGDVKGSDSGSPNGIYGGINIKQNGLSNVKGGSSTWDFSDTIYEDSVAKMVPSSATGHPAQSSSMTISTMKQPPTSRPMVMPRTSTVKSLIAKAEAAATTGAPPETTSSGNQKFGPRLNPRITEVYRDRNVGLGLAPSLLKILKDDAATGRKDPQQEPMQVGSSGPSFEPQPSTSGAQVSQLLNPHNLHVVNGEVCLPPGMSSQPPTRSRPPPPPPPSKPPPPLVPMPRSRSSSRSRLVDGDLRRIQSDSRDDLASDTESMFSTIRRKNDKPLMTIC